MTLRNLQLAFGLLLVGLVPGCSNPTPASLPAKPKRPNAAQPVPRPTETVLQKKQRQKAEKLQAQAKERAAEKAARIVFDVPRLVSKSVEEIEVILGKPGDDINLQSVGMTSMRTWSKRGYSIMVDYRPGSGSVNGILFCKDVGQAKTKHELLQAANMQENDPAYSVEISETHDSSGIASIVAKPRN